MNCPSKLKYFGVMLDCSRNAVMRTETVKRYVDLVANLGFKKFADRLEKDLKPFFE